MNKKILIILILMIFLIGIISSSCDNNNVFASGETVDVCISNCSYKSTYSSNYIPCDGNVSCSLFVTNSSGYVILNGGNMSRTIDSSFNYSIGNASSYNATLMGDYICLSPYGKIKNNFYIYAATPAGGGGGGGGGGFGGTSTIIYNNYTYITQEVQAENKSIPTDINNYIDLITERVSPLYKGYGKLIVIILLLMIIFSPEITTAVKRLTGRFKKKKNG